MAKGSRGGKRVSGGGRANGKKYDTDGVELVDYDDWKESEYKLFNKEYNEDGTLKSYQLYEDLYNHTLEPEIRDVTLKDVKKDIEAWKNDDGTYGDNDTHIFVSYADGSYISTDDLDFEKKYAKNKRNIIGACISTPDYEMVAGYEFNRGKKELMKTWSEDGKSGLPNTYSGYKETEIWYEKQLATYTLKPRKDGSIYAQRTSTTVLRSTKKKF